MSTPPQLDILFSQVIPETCNRVLAVANELCLRLSTMVVFSVYVRQYGGNLTIWAKKSVQWYLECAESEELIIPPSSFAITSAFPSWHCISTLAWERHSEGSKHTPDVCAIELVEFPKDIPIACRSAASGVSGPLDPSLIV